MKALINNSSDGSGWWSTVTAVATGNTTMKTVPTASATGASRARRLVVTGWSITGHNTNAAATTFAIRNATTTTIIFKGGSLAPTSGQLDSTVNGVWLPGAAGESLQLNIGGAFTGVLSVTVWGRIVSADSPFLTDNATGAP